MKCVWIASRLFEEEDEDEENNDDENNKKEQVWRGSWERFKSLEFIGQVNEVAPAAKERQTSLGQIDVLVGVVGRVVA